MADSIIQVPVDSTGKKVDTESLTVGANTVERQRIQIAGSSAAQIAPVTAANGLGVDVTRVQGTVTVGDGGGSLTVDGSVNIGNTPSVDPTDRALRDNGKVDIAQFDVSTADLDSGAGTDTRLTVGIAVPAAGGAAIVTGDASNGLDVDVTRLPSLPAGTNNIGDVDVLSLPALPAGTNNIGDVDVLTLPALPAGNNNIGDVDVVSLPALPAGNNNIGDVDVASLPSIPAGSNLIGNVGLDPRTSGGLTTYHLVSAGSTNASNVKASAGQLFGWYIYNSNAAARKVAFHNTSGTPTAGASIFFTLVIPAGGAANVFSDIGIPFSSGIAITTVTGLADSDNTAVAANDLIINLFYK